MQVKRELLQLAKDFFKDPSNREEFAKWKREQVADQSKACSLKEVKQLQKDYTMDLGWTIGQATISLLAIVGLADFLEQSEVKETIADFLAGMTLKSLLTSLLLAFCLYVLLFWAAL